MKKRLSALCVLGACVLVCCGCQAARIGQQGCDLRRAMLKMYDDQIMDNLIRARNYEPFVQLEYSDLLVQESDLLEAGGSGGETVTDTRTTASSGAAALGVVRSIASVWSINGKATRKGLLSFHAEPVTKRNRVYARYIADAADHEFLVEHDTKPSEDDCHRVEKWGKKYYCIPKKQAKKYLELALATTFQLGPKVVVGYYAVTIKDIEEVEKTGVGDSVKATLTFDISVPNDNAIMIVERADGTTARLPLFQVETLASGLDTKKLDAEWSPDMRGIEASELKGLKARIYPEKFPPGIIEEPPVARDIRRFKNTLERIQGMQGLQN